MTYSEARSSCLDIGGRLTSVLDQEERDYLLGELSSETDSAVVDNRIIGILRNPVRHVSCIIRHMLA